VSTDGETKILISKAARLFPAGRFGKPRHTWTIARYIRVGIAIDGDVIKLEGGADTGGSWWTTAEAFERFFRRLTAARLGNDAQAFNLPATPRSPPVLTDIGHVDHGVTDEYQQLRAATKNRRKAKRLAERQAEAKCLREQNRPNRQKGDQ
jgi:hypothetical protein